MSPGKKIDTGGAAFPGKAYSGVPNEGMTLRDYFAEKVMQAHVTAQWSHIYATKPNDEVNHYWEGEDIAMFAYDMADAMLEARK